MANERSIRPLVFRWIAYWTVLALVGLGRPALAIWRATRAPEGQGNIGLNFGDGQFTLTVAERGVTTYAGSISFLALAAWVAGPPLIAWIVWLVRRRKSEPVATVSS